MDATNIKAASSRATGANTRMMKQYFSTTVVATMLSSLSACNSSQPLDTSDELVALQRSGLLDLPQARLSTLNTSALSASVTVNAVTAVTSISQITVGGSSYLELQISLPSGTLKQHTNTLVLNIHRTGQLEEQVNLVVLEYSFDYDNTTVTVQTSSSNYPDDDSDGLSNLTEFDAASLDTDADGVWDYRDGTVTATFIAPTLRYVGANTFNMGCYPSDPGCLGNEQPVHAVTLNAFQIAETEVTFEEFDLFCNDTGAVQPEDSGYGRGQKPVINVSWHDANRYIEWLNGKTGHSYRLPSEAEYEYVMRDGSTTIFPWGNSYNHSEANYGAEICCEGGTRDLDNWFYTAPVGSMDVNGFGLHDISGNVWEWTADSWHEGYSSAPADSSAWTYGGDNSEKVLRGGGWNSGSFALRSAFRYKLNEYSRVFASGFRLARSVSSE